MSPNDARRSPAGINWSAVTRLLAIQILVLSALAYGVTRYIAWSSDATFAEFSQAIEAVDSGAAPSAGTTGPKLASVQRVRQTTDCTK